MHVQHMQVLFLSKNSAVDYFTLASSDAAKKWQLTAYKKQVQLLIRKQFYSRLHSITAKMMFKTFVLIGCAIVVQAGLLPEKAEDAYESHPSYSFSYDVQDVNTGDFKSQSETRDGDNVQGRYALNDPDGYRRIVEYSSDAVSGFQAHVRREPLDGSPIVANAPAPLLKQAVQTKTVQLQQINSPVQLKSYVQPAAVLRTFSAPAIVHPAPPTFIHSSPAVHLAPALLKSAPAQVITHHQPAAVVKTTFAAPHVSFVY